MKKTASRVSRNIPTPQAKGDSRPRHRWAVALIGIGLFLVVLATFWPILKNGFINYDDPDYVTANKHVEEGLSWQSLKWAFASTSETLNWHPITWLSHIMDYQLFGQSARGHHLTSVLLHAVNAVLLFLLLNRMTGEKGRSLAVAGFFGLHPLRVESVAWVSERKDVLSGFFFMLTLIAYVEYARARGASGSASVVVGESSGVCGAVPKAESPRPSILKKRSSLYCLSVLCFCFGLMSKPMLVSLPFVLLLLDYWPLGRASGIGWRAEGGGGNRSGRLFWEKLPFFLLSAAASLVALFSQKRSVALGMSRPLMDRLENAVISYGRYLGKMFWPTGLSIHYPHPEHWSGTVVALGAALMGGISLGAVVLRRRQPYLAVGWFWYVGMLVPVIGIVQVGIQSMADRYTYLPSIGVMIMLVWGIRALLAQKESKEIRAWAPRLAAMGALVGCVILTARQIGYWKDSGTVFEHAAQVTRNNKVALVNLGSFLMQRGRISEAIDVYRQALKIDPTLEEPQVNLGVMLYVSGQHEMGIQQLEEGLKVLPNSALLHGNLGFFLAQSGQLDEAARHLETVLKIEPHSAEAHLGLGDICARKGDRDGAIEQYRQALKLQPGYLAAEKRLNLMAPR